MISDILLPTMLQFSKELEIMFLLSIQRACHGRSKLSLESIRLDLFTMSFVTFVRPRVDSLSLKLILAYIYLSLYF